MVGAAPEILRHPAQQPVLHLPGRLAGGDPGCGSRRGRLCVSTAIVGSPNAVLSTTLAVLRPTPGRASSAARRRGTSPPCSSTRMRQVLHDVGRLGVEQADGLDELPEPVDPEVEHGPGRVGDREQRAGGLIDAHVGGLWRRQHDRDEQLERRAEAQLGGRLRVPGPQAGEDVGSLGLVHGCPVRRSPPL